MRFFSVIAFFAAFVGLVTTTQAYRPANPCDTIKCLPGYSCVQLNKLGAARCLKDVRKCRDGYLPDVDNNCVPVGTYVR